MKLDLENYKVEFYKNFKPADSKHAVYYKYYYTFLIFKKEDIYLYPFDKILNLTVYCDKNICNYFLNRLEGENKILSLMEGERLEYKTKVRLFKSLLDNVKVSKKECIYDFYETLFYSYFLL